MHADTHAMTQTEVTILGVQLPPNMWVMGIKPASSGLEAGTCTQVISSVFALVFKGHVLLYQFPSKTLMKIITDTYL